MIKDKRDIRIRDKARSSARRGGKGMAERGKHVY